jgi:hypothetical protein
VVKRDSGRAFHVLVTLRGFSRGKSVKETTNACTPGRQCCGARLDTLDVSSTKSASGVVSAST